MRLTATMTKRNLNTRREIKAGAHPCSNTVHPDNSRDKNVILFGLYRESQILAGRDTTADPKNHTPPSMPACTGVIPNSSVIDGSMTPMDIAVMGITRFKDHRKPITTQRYLGGWVPVSCDNGVSGVEFKFGWDPCLVLDVGESIIHSGTFHELYKMAKGIICKTYGT